MTTTAHHVAAAVSAILSPLAAFAAVVARGGEGPSDASTLWQALGSVAPLALWGLPLAYVVISVAAVLPRHPKTQTRLDEPRDATFVDRLSIFTDSREGW
jgi:hypothetical protein